MSAPLNVAVIGLGMIGGSVARGLAARGVQILGYDTNNAYLDAAVAEGVVTQRISESFDELATVDAVVLAVYGSSAAKILEQLERHAESITLVTDVGSTKRGIVSAAEQSRIGKSFSFVNSFSSNSSRRSRKRFRSAVLLKKRSAILFQPVGPGRDCTPSKTGTSARLNPPCQ